MRKRRRVDSNQAEIVEALRQHGCSVECLSDVGRGIPDLLVGAGGRNYLIEVKLPGQKPNDIQKAWHKNWAGWVLTVESADQAIAWSKNFVGLAEAKHGECAPPQKG